MTATVRVAGLRGFEPLVRELGGDPVALTRACGIDVALLRDDEALITYRSFIHLLEHSATELRCPDFGLRLGQSQDIGVLGPLAVAMQNSTTAESAMHCAATYLFVQSPALSLDIDSDTETTRFQINIRLKNMPHAAMVQAVDLSIGVAVGILRMLAGSSFQLTRVELPHPPLCLESDYSRHFGAPVVFDCAETVFCVPTATMQTELAEGSDMLRKLASTYLDVLFPSPDGTVTSRVEIAIRKTLGTDSCNRESVAQAMATHPRTLQRQLAREGESFDEIRDRIRCDLADHYLCQTEMPLAQVAGLLGYGEQSILSRSCRRWFGESPLKIRSAASH